VWEIVIKISPDISMGMWAFPPDVGSKYLYIPVQLMDGGHDRSLRHLEVFSTSNCPF
jgi:hypothetical protein